MFVVVGLVDTIPSFLDVCSRGCSVEEVLRGYLEPYREALEGFVGGRLGGWEELASRIAGAVERAPGLVAAIEQLYSRKLLPLRSEIVGEARLGLERLSEALGVKLDADIVFMVTGFDSALSAYRGRVYVGVEWFVDPGAAGLSRGSPLYQVVSRLSEKPVEFIVLNTLHELVHTATPRVEGDPFLSRLLEEGRAVYIAWLLGSRRLSREAIVPTVFHGLREYGECATKLLRAVQCYLERGGDSREWEEMFFGVEGRDPVCGLRLAGYYVGMYLAQILHDYYNGDLVLLARTSTPEPLERILAANTC